MQEKRLKITNHNRYKCRTQSYDEYSVLVLDPRRNNLIDWSPRRLLADILYTDLGISNMQDIKINVTWTLVSHLPPAIGMFFFDLEESVLFKLYYS